MKTIILVCIGIGLWVVINLVFLNCYPQLICCTKEVTFKNYKIAFCDDISNVPSLSQTETLINDAELLIKKTDVFKRNTKFKIFVKNDKKECKLSPKMMGGAKTLERLKNYFFVEQNFATLNKAGNMDYNRPLSSIMAHQFIHVLIVNKYGWYKTRLMTLFDQNSRTKTHLLWKEEGYADYMTNGTKFSVANLPSADFPEIDSEADVYLKSYVAVKYLIEVNNMKIKEIINSDLNLNTIYTQAKNYYTSNS